MVTVDQFRTYELKKLVLKKNCINSYNSTTADDGADYTATYMESTSLWMFMW